MESKITFRGEAALVLAVIINSFGVVLMLYSGAGISAISSVPHAGHLDIHISRAAGAHADDNAAQIRALVPL